MRLKRSLALISLIALWSSAVDTAGAANSGRISNATPVTNLKLIRFQPTHVRTGVVVFKPSGVAPSTVKRADLRIGNRRREVSLKYVRHALRTDRTVSLTRPHPLRASGAGARRRNSRAARRLYEKSGRPARLEIVFQPSRPPAAGVFFVSPQGSDANPGTRSRPLLSLGRAYLSAVPGDTVEVEGGEYTAQQTIPYDPSKVGAPVTFVASEEAHFVSAEPTDSYWTNIKAGNLTFKGSFEFDDVYVREDKHEMSNITFEGTWIHHLTEGGHLDGFNLLHNRMGPNNIWPNTGPAFLPTTGPSDILDMGIEQACAPASKCFELSAEDVNIVGNEFNGAYRSWSGSHADCIQYGVGQSGYIADNTFTNCASETLILQDYLGELANIDIENNYLSRPLENSNPFPIQISPCHDCVIRFNSVPATGSPAAELVYPAKAFHHTVEPSGKIYGNIAGHYYSGQCSGTEAEGWTWSYNLFIGKGGTCGSNAAMTETDPYAEQNTMDLNAVPSSPSVNFYQGSEPVPATDIDGDPRPLDGYADAGAYEAGS